MFFKKGMVVIALLLFFGAIVLSDVNTAIADYSSISGGWRNIAGDPYLVDHSIGPQSVVSAGSNNVASGDRRQYQEGTTI